MYTSAENQVPDEGVAVRLGLVSLIVGSQDPRMSEMEGTWWISEVNLSIYFPLGETVSEKFSDLPNYLS